MTAQNALLFCLPHAGSMVGDAPAHWWHITDGAIVQRGTANDWPIATALLRDTDAPACIAIAPAGDSSIRWHDFGALTAPQMRAAARIAVGDSSAAPIDSLHVIVGAGERDATDSGTSPVVVTAISAMQGWLAYAAQLDVMLTAIVPAALIPPHPAHGGIDQAMIGNETVWRGSDLASVAEPGLLALLRPGATVLNLDAGAVDHALIAATITPPANLLSGPFAPAGAPWLNHAWLRRILIGIAILLTLSGAIALARIIHYHSAIQSLNAAAMAEVGTVLSPAPLIDDALPALDAQLAQRGGGTARMTVPLAALIQALESAPTVAIDSANWRADGTLLVTLGGARADDINPVLLALQAAGYRVTAQPRTGSDGRALGDITIRSTP